jgi:shikimate dehydrogenase
LNYAYLAFHVTNLPGMLAGMRAMPSFRGLSVTIPHKEAIIPLLDEIDPLAQAVGSVNTVTNDGGKLIGSTTDGRGMLRALADASEDLAAKNVLVLGSGGAVRAAAFALACETDAAKVAVYARPSDRLWKLQADLAEAAKVPVTVDTMADHLDSAEALGAFDVIIQGTSVGMTPNDAESIVPGNWFREGQVVFDMVYRPHQTKFLRDAKTAGCKIVYGIEMLVHQAALQFETWTGVVAPVDAMRAAVKELI